MVVATTAVLAVPVSVAGMEEVVVVLLPVVVVVTVATQSGLEMLPKTWSHGTKTQSKVWGTSAPKLHSNNATVGV